jgi:hypothetical protein
MVDEVLIRQPYTGFLSASLDSNRLRKNYCDTVEIWFVLFFLLIWFIWLVSFNQTNQTNQITIFVDEMSMGSSDGY